MILRKAADLIIGTTIVDVHKSVQHWVITDLVHILWPARTHVTLTPADDPFIADQRRIVLLYNDLVQVIPEDVVEQA